ncbi:MAG TPA: hypothetical protein PK941_07100 [Paludibacter sp.]|nr:hypothetical protein [Paludibacter sp.]
MYIILKFNALCQSFIHLVRIPTKDFANFPLWKLTFIGDAPCRVVTAAKIFTQGRNAPQNPFVIFNVAHNFIFIYFITKKDVKNSGYKGEIGGKKEKKQAKKMRQLFVNQRNNNAI